MTLTQFSKWCIPGASLPMVMLTLFAGPVAGSPVPPTWRKWVNGYEIVKWSYREHPKERRDPSSISRFDDRITIAFRDPKGRTVVRFTNMEAGLAFVRRSPLGPPMAGFYSELYTSDGGWGRHFRVYSLGRRTRCLVEYTTQVNELHDRFRPLDLNHDGRLEILTEFDGFAGGFIGPWWAGFGLPMVLAWRNGRYVEATVQFPTVLRKELRRSDAELARAMKGPYEIDARGDRGFRVGLDFNAVARNCALRVLLHGRRRALNETLHKLPKAYRKDLIAHYGQIETMLATRRKRLKYPAPYVKPKGIDDRKDNVVYELESLL